MKIFVIFRLALGTLLLFLSAVFSHAYSSSDEILTAINSTRSDNKQNVLTFNSQLNQAASVKLADIQKYLYWSHDNPETGKKWLSFIRESGYRAGTGENLAKGYDGTNELISAWLNSPAHRKNLLSSKFKSCGIAYGQVNYADGPQTVVVLVFGTTDNKKISLTDSIISSSLLAYLNPGQWLN